ncbi:hypothetical protein [Streptomyces solaniscabiei]|uniref:hypothetical protein n=1 Tax=Streptomyces solaniscabiei TaxID=2683255 RepID=UPI001CE38625|nr:hypothetical protein [Streptomyces solaniscabiei]
MRGSSTRSAGRWRRPPGHPEGAARAHSFLLGTGRSERLVHLCTAAVADGDARVDGSITRFVDWCLRD